MSQCTELVNIASAGVAPALRAVDCVAGEMTAAAFSRLFGAEGAMAPVLTIVLTLYIAFFAISLLTGRSSLSVSALTPRMLTLGLVLTFATSWAAYSQVVWNLTVGAPDWIAGVVIGGSGPATQLFADRIDIVFAAIGQIAEAGAAAGDQGATAGSGGMFQPADIMWLGALLLLLGTVGVLLTARIALAILLALGPVFVVLGLFEGTRGLTAGWLRGVALTALTPLFVVLGGSITLELMVPVLAALGASLEGLSGRAALALFLIAAVHVALMAMVMKVATTMVMSWQVFGLAPPRARSEGAAAGAAASVVGEGQAGHAPIHTDRRMPLVVSGAAIQDMDGSSPRDLSAGSGAGSAGHDPGRRSVVTQVSGGGVQPLSPRKDERARGIGSRFRNASNDGGRPAMARTPAKEKIS